MNIAIIGAGFTGCYLAHRLKQYKVNVTLFEKSRGVGGRMATRQEKELYINHGLFQIEPQGVEFQTFCNEMVELGLLMHKNETVYTAGRMNQLLQYLSQEAQLKTSTEIREINHKNGRYRLLDSYENSYRDFDFLFITIPSKQIVNLKSNFSHTMRDEIKNVTFDSVATLVLYGTNTQHIDITKLSLIKNLKTINNTNSNAIVIHMNPTFSNSVNHQSKEEIGEKIEKQIRQILPDFRRQEYGHFAHLWKYGLTSKPLGKPYIYDEKYQYAIVADWLLGDRLEDAYDSVNHLFKSRSSLF